MSSHRWHNFPLNWGFKLTVGSKPPFSDSEIFELKKPRVGNSWFKKGSESPLILKPPFKRNLFISSHTLTYLSKDFPDSLMALFFQRKMEPICLPGQVHFICILNAFYMRFICVLKKCMWVSRLFFRFKPFAVATCDCYLIKQHGYFWLLLAISTRDCYVRYIHIVTCDCCPLAMAKNALPCTVLPTHKEGSSRNLRLKTSSQTLSQTTYNRVHGRPAGRCP